MSVTWFALPPPAELGEGWSLGFLTAARMLECRGEGEAMAGEERDKALWANAALLSKVLLKEGEPAFEDGKEAAHEEGHGESTKGIFDGCKDYRGGEEERNPAHHICI